MQFVWLVAAAAWLALVGCGDDAAQGNDGGEPETDAGTDMADGGGFGRDASGDATDGGDPEVDAGADASDGALEDGGLADDGGPRDPDAAVGDAGATGFATARAHLSPLVAAACGWMFECCASGELRYQLGGFTGDAADCTERILDAIASGSPLALVQTDLSSESAEALLRLVLSIDEGRVAFDDDAIAQCSAATTNRACNEAVHASPAARCSPPVTMQAACEPEQMFVGRQQVGSPCDEAWECAAPLDCVDLGFGDVCVLRSAQDEPCFSDLECADGLLCDWASGTCRQGAGSGEACAFADPASPIPGTETIRCAEGLSCDSITSTCVGAFCTAGAVCADVFGDTDCPETYLCIGNSFTVPTCRMPGAEGAPCSKASDCQSSYCDPFNELCAELLGSGEPCFDDFECASGFCDNGTGLCNPSASPGQPCPSFNDAECAGGYCDQDPTTPTCQAFSSENGACSRGVECDPDGDLQCVDGACLRRPYDDGVSCSASSQCKSQVCWMGECSAGAAIDAACRTDGSMEPCVLGAYCEAPLGFTDGSCAPLRRPGEACERDDQCWGACVTRFGDRMCDATPALALDELWCDGP